MVDGDWREKASFFYFKSKQASERLRIKSIERMAFGSAKGWTSGQLELVEHCLDVSPVPQLCAIWGATTGARFEQLPNVLSQMRRGDRVLGEEGRCSTRDGEEPEVEGRCLASRTRKEGWEVADSTT